MNNNILQTLFLDNPKLPTEIEQFCKSLPEYTKATQEYTQVVQEMAQFLGYQRYSRLEEALNACQAMECAAHYLFGLGLREELLRGLGAEP